MPSVLNTYVCVCGYLVLLGFFIHSSSPNFHCEDGHKVLNLLNLPQLMEGVMHHLLVETNLVENNQPNLRLAVCIHLIT